MKEVEQIEMLNGQILILPNVIKEGKTGAGIIVPKSVKEKYDPKWGRVVKVAKDVENIKKNDTVLMLGFPAGEITLDSTTYLMAPGNKILAIIPKK